MAYNPNGGPPVDWSYDSVMDAPNYLSFEGGPGGYPNRGRGGPQRFPRGNTPPWQQQQRGRGRGGPPPPFYGGRGGGPPGPGYHPYHPPPPPMPLGEYYRPPKHYQSHPPVQYYPREQRGGRGFYDRGPRGGRFQRSRGGRRPAYMPTGNEPITAFFHPSMLEDPWAPPTAKKSTETAAQKALTDEAAKVKIEDNDPELLQIVGEMKEQQASTEGPIPTEGSPNLESAKEEDGETTESKEFAAENVGETTESNDAEMKEAQ